jgi:chitodextrinase
MSLIDRARVLRAQFLKLRGMADDQVALQVPDLYPVWEVGVSYVTGDRVLYNEILYKVLQNHTSQETWIPTETSSLYAKVLIPDVDVIPEWVQPDSTNPYMTGDKVTHNGKTWVSIVDNNVWEPGAYGWNEVTE